MAAVRLAGLGVTLLLAAFLEGLAWAIGGAVVALGLLVWVVRRGVRAASVTGAASGGWSRSGAGDRPPTLSVRGAAPLGLRGVQSLSL
ncbi:MAG: hypothetical protein U0360_00670 [Dehalococcoidia bacterium]